MAKRTSKEKLREVLRELDLTTHFPRLPYELHSRTRIYVDCAVCGHSYDVQLQTLLAGHRCSQCANRQKSESMKIPLRVVQNELESAGYTLINPYDYVNSNTKIILRTPTGQYWTTTMKRFRTGQYRAP